MKIILYFLVLTGLVALICAAPEDKPDPAKAAADAAAKAKKAAEDAAAKAKNAAEDVAKKAKDPTDAPAKDIADGEKKAEKELKKGAKDCHKPNIVEKVVGVEKAVVNLFRAGWSLFDPFDL